MLNRRGGVIQSTIYAVHCSRFVNPLLSPSPPLIPFNLLPLPIPRFVPQFSIRIEIYSFTHTWLKVSRDNIFEEGRVILDVESINNVENSAGDSLDSFTFEKSSSLDADRKRDKGVKQQQFEEVRKRIFVHDNSHQHFLLYGNRGRKNGGERKTNETERISREEARNLERSSSFNGRPASAKGQLVTVPWNWRGRYNWPPLARFPSFQSPSRAYLLACNSSASHSVPRYCSKSPETALPPNDPVNARHPLKRATPIRAEGVSRGLMMI